MVCKEEVLSWFKDLESYKRIDVLYELLNMCLPFELRFLGSCVEEIGKHTYEDLRGQTLTANDLEKLTKDGLFTQNLLDENVRHRVLIYLSLLSSKNYSVANRLFRTVLRTDWLHDCVVKGSLKDENVQSEFLLLYVMAMHHPAFTFDQKLYFNKILAPLLELKESNNHMSSPKPNVIGYPPGFGYPSIKSVNSSSEVSGVPVKTSVTIPCANETLHQQAPGLPHLPTAVAVPLPQDFVAWSHPGFPCRPPEVTPPFPPPTVSPLVSQSSSPIHSRNSSPHPTIVVPTRLPPPTQPPPSIEAMSVTMPPLLGDPLSPITFISLPPENMKIPDEDLTSMPEEKLISEPALCPTWATSLGPQPLIAGGILKEIKQPNGLRFPHVCPPPPSKPVQRPPPFLMEAQFQALNLMDGGTDGSLQRSNSSSCSSLNQSPPDTPSATPATLPRVDKPRVNGMPSTFAAAVPPPVPTPSGALPPPAVPPPPPPLCDATSPPPPTFNNCSTVPYTYQTTTFAAIPTRSMFPYNTQSYRPPFTAHFPSAAAFQATNENSFSTYTYPYHMSIFYSSPAAYPRSSNCYNCGMVGHTGEDCSAQNIEDITQKKTYTIDYAPPPLPDADK